MDELLQLTVVLVLVCSLQDVAPSAHAGVLRSADHWFVPISGLAQELCLVAVLFRELSSFFIQQGIWILNTVSSSSVYQLRSPWMLLSLFSVVVVRSSEFIVDRTE